jgi:hypothetical protein
MKSHNIQATKPEFTTAAVTQLFLHIIPEIHYDNPQWLPETAMQLTQN